MYIHPVPILSLLTLLHNGVGKGVEVSGIEEGLNGVAAFTVIG